MMDELEALVVLVNIAPGDPDKLRLAIEECGSATATLNAPLSKLTRLPGFGEKLSGSIRRWEQDFSWRQDLDLIRRHNVELVPFWDSRFPRSLRSIPDAPALLYVNGSLMTADRQACAIVGTRNHSAYGGEIASRLSRDLAALGFTIVSGLTQGIETLAHRGAMQVGRTIAVIGAGLASVFPSENEPLAREIANYGAVISELPMATTASKVLLTRRHRLISGLSKGVILVEASTKSSAMITMKDGWRQGRKLFAIPGTVDAESFRGNHLLIKRRCAQLVEDARDVVELCKDLRLGMKSTMSTGLNILPQLGEIEAQRVESEAF